MQAADDVKLGDRFRPPLGCPLPDFFQRPRVGLRIFHALTKRAQFATCDANVGGVYVPIDIEPGDISILAFANNIGQVAQAEQITRTVESYAVIKSEPLAIRNLARDNV